MRLMGALLIIISSTAIGMLLSQRMYKRLQSIERLIAAISSLRVSICVMGVELSTALKSADKAMQSEVVLASIADSLEKYGAEQAWQKGFSEFKDRLCLNERDLEIIKTAGKRLGATNSEDQGKNLDNLTEQLRLQAVEARAQYEKNGRLTRSCGILFGLLMALVLI